MSSMLGKCPKCSCMIARGQPCPNCHWSEESADPENAAQQQSVMEEYERRRKIHVRNYAIFMTLTLALGMVTMILVGLAYMRRGARFLGVGNTGVGIGSVGHSDAEIWVGAGMLLLSALWLGLTVLLFLSKRLLPRELNCPKCEIRLDELGVKDGHCPGCQVKLS